MPDHPLQLGQYLLLEKIAQGGMAQVFKAKTVDPGGIERLVVIKRILPHISADSDYVAMLIDEAKIAVHFNQGNIAQIYDLGKAGDDYFIVMEYVDGKTLGQILRDFKEREKKIPIPLIVYCISELCQGLDYIHRKNDQEGRPLGVVHRDISPQNIIVSYSGTVKLIDFGVAKSFEKLSHTQSGVLKGKFAYMSPEQAEGDEIDRRSDIFATGILLWEMLTLERLFKKSSNKETLKAVRQAQFQAPSSFRKEIHAELDSICEKALKKRKEKRYQSASEMAGDLTRFLAKHYPEFKRLDVAEFLYRYFGPEADEEDLPAEFPELQVEKEKKPEKKPPAFGDEEKTEIDYQDRLKKFFSKRFTRYGVLLFFTVVVLVLSAMGFYSIYDHYSHGTLSLIINPPDAELLIDDELIDLENGKRKIRLKSDNEIRVTAKKKGHVSIEQTLFLKGGEVKNLEISLEKEIPPFGKIFVSSNPEGATIYINNTAWNQKTPAEIPHLQSDKRYTIGLFLEGHDFYEQTVDLKRGETHKIEASLQVRYGSLEVTSNPPGATVYFDDQIVGQTPFTESRMIPFQLYELKLSLIGYQEIEDQVIVEAGENKKLIFDLQKSEN